MIRPAVNADVEYLTKFDHSVETQSVWQMDQFGDKETIQIRFQEARLPRTMKVLYPYNQAALGERWRFHTLTLVACISNAPVGYVSVSTLIALHQLWVKDLVVDQNWRRQGIATGLLRAVRDWGVERNFLTLLLEMSSKNYPMINMCKGLGFQFCGYHDHYFNGGDIALFFIKQMKQVF